MDNKVKTKINTLDDKKKTFAESAIVVGAILLICYFLGFSYIWNTDVGAEVGVNGWNYIIACFSWSFKKTGAAYGDIAVPFYYYAKEYVPVMAVATTVSFGILLLFIAISCFNIKKYNRKLAIAIMVILYVLAAAYLACIVIALTMNGSRILPKYCNSNPKCSIATLVFFPFFITLAYAIITSVYIRKFRLEEEAE